MILAVEAGSATTKHEHCVSLCHHRTKHSTSSCEDSDVVLTRSVPEAYYAESEADARRELRRVGEARERSVVDAVVETYDKSRHVGRPDAWTFSRSEALVQPGRCPVTMMPKR